MPGGGPMDAIKDYTVRIGRNLKKGAKKLFKKIKLIFIGIIIYILGVWIITFAINFISSIRLVTFTIPFNISKSSCYMNNSLGASNTDSIGDFKHYVDQITNEINKIYNEYHNKILENNGECTRSNVLLCPNLIRSANDRINDNYGIKAFASCKQYSADNPSGKIQLSDLANSNLICIDQNFIKYAIQVNQYLNKTNFSAKCIMKDSAMSVVDCNNKTPNKEEMMQQINKLKYLITEDIKLMPENLREEYKNYANGIYNADNENIIIDDVKLSSDGILTLIAENYLTPFFGYSPISSSEDFLSMEPIGDKTFISLIRDNILGNVLFQTMKTMILMIIIVVYGYSFVFSGGEDKKLTSIKEIIKKLIIIGFVMWGTRPESYELIDDWIMPGIFKIMTGVTAILSEAAFNMLDISEIPSSNILETYDLMISYLGSINLWRRVLGLAFSGIGVIILPVIITVIFYVIFYIIKNIGGIIMALIILAFNVAIAPIAILFMLHEKTRPQFDQWIKNLTKEILGFSMGMFVMSITIGLFIKNINQMLNFSVCKWTITVPLWLGIVNLRFDLFIASGVDNSRFILDFITSTLYVILIVQTFGNADEIAGKLSGGAL